MAQVKMHGTIKEYPEGTTWMKVAREHQEEYEYGILLVRIDGKLQRLYKQVKDCELSFVIAKDKPGTPAYQRSAPLIILKAFYSVVGPGNVEKLMIDFSIGWGFFVEAGGNPVLGQELLDVVKAKMRKYVERKIPIMKHSVSTDDAVELFKKLGMYNKAKLLRYCMVSKVNIYSTDRFEDCCYGYTVQNIDYIKHSNLTPYHYGFVIVMPGRNTPDILHKFAPSDKLLAALFEPTKQGGQMDLEMAGALDDEIAKGDMFRLILIQEVLQEKKIVEITAQIVAGKNARSAVIARPSSSSKTTFSYRLSAQPKVIGLKPHPIAVDNYLMDRMDSPRDEHGSYDCEILECLDVELSSRDMASLLEEERVELPYYNFKKGARKYKGNFLQLGEGDIPVIEGIHRLDDRFPYTLPTDSKFKIHISILTQLNIDEYNYIPTISGRLPRRMAWDARIRGSSTREIIRMWPSARGGGEENIFPFQEEADAMFNSVLVCELAVLKQYTQSLLFAIPRDSEEQPETKRLFKSLDYLIGVSGENIPKNFALREFIGGSCLNVRRPQRGRRDETDRFLAITVQETALFCVF